ncbi:RINT-1 family protein [Panus rudis PR-1116 ss-1]|nr:RINT-1 family protein [Panus rudis PR-1116 ss-1]
MASTHIQALLGPPSTPDSHKRALDFLNSHYKSYDELLHSNDFDDILERSRINTEDLKAKLAASQEHVNQLIHDTREQAQSHLHTAQELSLLRHSLADELAYLSEQLVSSLGDPGAKPTLLEDIESMHRNLKELESLKSYVQVIQHALQLSETAVQKAKTAPSPLTAVSDYENLQKFVSSVNDACTNVEDGAGHQKLHVLVFLEGIRDKTWNEIKAVLTSTLLEVAEKLQWPGVVDYRAANVEDRKAFETAFSNLLKLQKIGEKLNPSNSRSEKDGLYPLQALVQPVALRFKYHFESNRQTNRLDKPEWYFTHVINVAHEQRPFMDNIIQQLLASTEYRSYNAWREFTLLLLPLITRKLRRTIPSLISHPPVLAHTIYQALAFDTALREEGFGLEGTSAVLAAGPSDENKSGETPKWDGVSDVILGRKEWFEAWVEGEKQFAMNQYMEIISAPDAWLISDDSDDTPTDDPDTTNGGPRIAHPQLKSTNSARRVKHLVEQITDRYSPLPQFSQRTRFLIAVQLPILESYHARIQSSLDAFETLSSSFIRAVPGALTGDAGGSGSAAGGGANDSRRLTSGVEGVQRLCKALISARYLSAAMEAWGEDLFFLELWTEINHKASLRSRAKDNSSLPDPKTTVTSSGEISQEVPEGTIFEELIEQYDKLAERAEDMIVQTICSEVESGLRAHFASSASVSTSSTPVTPVHSSSSNADDIALSATLLGPIALLSSHLTFLSSAFPPKTVTSLYRTIASRLATHILHRQILYRGRSWITPQYGKVVMAECELWAETCRLALSSTPSTARTSQRAEVPWRGLLQAARIVGADGARWDRITEVTFGVGDDEEWESDMRELVGFAELSREEVGQVIRARIESA